MGKERLFYSFGVTTYLFRRNTRAAKKKEERTRERTSERERERLVVFSYIYLLVVFIPPREKERIAPFFGRKKASFGRA